MNHLSSDSFESQSGEQHASEPATERDVILERFRKANIGIVHALVRGADPWANPELAGALAVAEEAGQELQRANLGNN